MSITYPALPNSLPAQHRTAPVPISIFFLSIFFQRLGIWISGFPFPLVLFLSPFILAFGFWQGRVKLCPKRLLIFLFFAGSVIISAVWGPNTKLTASLLFLLIYSQWLFYSPSSQEHYRNYFQRIAFYVSLLCLLGTIQYLSQFVVQLDYVFSWHGLIPSTFLIEHNVLNEVTYASGQYKGNGFFLLEPSTLSMLAGRTLLLVVLLLRDTRYILPLALGLAFSLSGTGLVFTLLFTAGPLAHLLAKNWQFSIVQFLVALSGILALGAIFLFYQDYFLERFFEFSEPGTSAHSRFTTTLIVFNEYVTRSVGTFLLGSGPGSFLTLTDSASVEYHDTGWIKLFVELGLLGTLSFCGFFLYCVHSATQSWYVAVAMLFQYVMLDSPILTPQCAFLAFSMYVFPVCADPEQAKAYECKGTDRLIHCSV